MHWVPQRERSSGLFMTPYLAIEKMRREITTEPLQNG
jgi:hypothetical protein